MNKILLLRVKQSQTLTGLGVLLQPESEGAELAQWPLHTALVVELRYTDKQEISAIGSVEELGRAGQPAVRTLLLTQEGDPSPPAGTEVWWAGAEARWENLL